MKTEIWYINTRFKWEKADTKINADQNQNRCNNKIEQRNKNNLGLRAKLDKKKKEPRNQHLGLWLESALRR